MSFCPKKTCKNYGRIPETWPNNLYTPSTTEAKGTQRFICKACGKTFSSFTPQKHEREINIAVARLLTGGREFVDICNNLNISPAILFKRIEAISEKFQEFENNELVKVEALNISTCTDNHGLLQVTISEKTGYLTELKRTENTSSNFLNNAQINSYLQRKVFKNGILPPQFQEIKPKDIQNILNIHRIWINFRVKGKDKQTPSMRSGMSKSLVDITKIL